MSNSAELSDYRWLTGPEAEPWLALCAAERSVSAALATRLRRALSAAQTHLVLEQVELRRRAAGKIPDAARLFFTRQQLEQATDQTIAGYKAARFERFTAAADLCCGIGGDLLALAEALQGAAGLVRGVERDPCIALLAQANCRARGLDAAEDDPACRHGAMVEPREANVEALGDAQAWHIDPDRRAAGRRSTAPQLHSPPLSEIEAMLAALPHAAVKLAPAGRPPVAWYDAAELEWISRGGECRQLVAWFGSLARHAGRRCATVLDETRTPRTIVGAGPSQPALPPAPAADVGPYVYEPDPAVIAAGLVDELAQDLGLAPLDPQIAYLTGERLCVDPAVTAFETLAALPFHLGRIKSLVRERGIGRLEIKQRGLPFSPADLERQLRGPGDAAATLLLMRRGDKPLAILARRVKRKNSP